MSPTTNPVGGVRASPFGGSAFIEGMIGSFFGARRSSAWSSSAEGLRSVIGVSVLPGNVRLR